MSSGRAFKSARRAPVHQRILLAVRDPDFAGAGRGDRRGEPVPVGVIGNDQRQLDAVLARPRAHAHPARRKRGDRIGKPPRPESFSADGGHSVIVPASSALPAPRTARNSPSAMPRLGVIAGDALHRAMQIDRRVVAGLAQQRDHALRLAERIGADEMRALGKQRDRMQQFGDLAVGIAVAEHRQRERRLGDEHVARHEFERRAGRIGDVLVIAGSDDAQAVRLDRDLRRAEHVAGRMERDRRAAELHALAVARSPASCRRNSRRSAAASGRASPASPAPRHGRRGHGRNGRA